MKNNNSLEKKVSFVVLLIAISFLAHAQSFKFGFGSFGTNNGQFNTPLKIVLVNANNSYVVDPLNHRVQKFNSAGVYQSQFGSFGTNNGQLNAPYDMAVDAGGNIYVADAGNARVQIFNNAGAYQFKFGVTGTNNGQFLAPVGVDFNNAGDIYVVDAGLHRVQVFTSYAGFVLPPIVGISFTKVKPKAGKKLVYRASKGFNVRGQVITTNTITGVQYAVLLSGTNATGTNSVSWITAGKFKTLKKPKKNGVRYVFSSNKATKAGKDIAVGTTTPLDVLIRAVGASNLTSLPLTNHFDTVKVK